MTVNQQAIADSELNCLECGACCRSGHDGRILVPETDLLRWREIQREDLARAVQPGHFGEVGFATRDDGSCVHLGTQHNANACSIYTVRASTCRNFQVGSRQCLEFRRDQGIE